ncbi:MAG: pyruvate ferredoxin oxidoreductase [Candidatus Methanoperedens sp.]|nr:pyruvate ferredoxin oxidoreductase [Candidatus Methanoperedens sp.]MCZ7358462.1 pyruvate ferredoxin oxidoreductase [Candidatus Methanoperedens sp.]HLB69971.1 transketolase C-terminal domain-containing protein [Candidatus Methanoperedens sp.]
MKKVITGDHAVAIGAKLCRVEVVPAYPITPQTLIIEHISDFVYDGELDARFLTMESEHSVMSAAAAAEAAGARVFTATSSQGLAFMHEMLYATAPLRLPVVMVNASRTLGGPPGIWCEYNDSMGARDSGWLQVYVEDNQEALDMVIQSYRIAEDKRVLLPVMPCIDGFVLTHTVEPVEVPEQRDVDSFLPAYDPDIVLDPARPAMIGTFMPAEYIMEMRRQTVEAFESAKKVIKEITALFARSFGRDYGGLIDTYHMEDAEIALVTMGTVTSTARQVVDELRQEGKKAGLVKLRFFRPFPSEELREVLSGIKAVGVADRSISYHDGGPAFNEIRSSLYGMNIPVIDHLAGIGGRDVTEGQIRKMFEITQRAAEGEKVKIINWHNTRGETV